MKHTSERKEKPGTNGLILHAAAGYDLLVWFLTLGRERTFRERMLRPAHLRPGESVLDMGCGTGTLAILAKRQVGSAGGVCGIDASPEMIARARKKASRAGVDVSFQNGFAQSLPFPEARFDVVLTTIMLHHLARKARADLAAEARRVLKPGGRVLAIDFAGTARNGKGFVDHIHRHGHVELKEIIALFRGAGLTIAESGSIGVRDLQFVVATLRVLPDAEAATLNVLDWTRRVEITTRVCAVDECRGSADLWRRRLVCSALRWLPVASPRTAPCGSIPWPRCATK